MPKFLRSFAVFPVLVISLLGNNHLPAAAQERQGCFMIDELGQLIDLSSICPNPPQFQAAGTPNLGTGDIQVTLRWTSTDDLDLAVNDPQGQSVTYYSPTVPSGGQLDVDANAGCGDGNTSPIENIFWPTTQAPQGSYSVAVNLFTRCQPANGPIPFTLTLLVQGTTQTLTGVVDESNPTAVFPFTLPLSN